MGAVSNLVIWRLDRLERTAKGLTSLFDDLIRWKVNLISLKDGLDLCSSVGRSFGGNNPGIKSRELDHARRSCVLRCKFKFI